MLYLGELNGRQEASWRKTVDLFDQDEAAPQQVALFPEAYAPLETADDDLPVVRIRLDQMSLRRPRQWGACWLGCGLWQQLGLDAFWRDHLPPSREGTRWDLVLQTLVLYRLIDPGSEWRLHRHWFDDTAIADLLGSDFSLAEQHKLYECHDKLLAHKRALFEHLTQRWRDLFAARYEVLLYDLTSTYFESVPPEQPDGLRRFGYSRDKRGDCVQVVIALIVTPEGFPLAYEVMPGNTADRTTLKARLRQSANGLTPRSALEKFATIQMLDVHLPTTDGREVVLTRYTHPEKDLQLLLDQLKLTLPDRPPPRISRTQV